MKRRLESGSLSGESNEVGSSKSEWFREGRMDAMRWVDLRSVEGSHELVAVRSHEVLSRVSFSSSWN